MTENNKKKSVNIWYINTRINLKLIIRKVSVLCFVHSNFPSIRFIKNENYSGFGSCCSRELFKINLISSSHISNDLFIIYKLWICIQFQCALSVAYAQEVTIEPIDPSTSPSGIPVSTSTDSTVPEDTSFTPTGTIPITIPN